MASQPNAMYSAKDLWDLDWEEFRSVLDWVNVSVALENASNLDMYSEQNKA